MVVARLSSEVNVFLEQLQTRLKIIRQEGGLKSVVLPVGLFLVIDEANGGDATAKELVKRLFLLDQESANLIDFYYLGWSAPTAPPLPQFSLSEFESFRHMLKQAGVKDFGGNADLILVDAMASGGHYSLRFEEAIHLDLSRLVKSGEIPNLGSFLHQIIATTEALRHAQQQSSEGMVFRISDRLGLAYAKESFLDFIFEKFGKIIGAKKLAKFATRRIGRTSALHNLRTKEAW